MTAKIEIVAVQPCGEGRLKDKKGGFRLEVTVAAMCNGIDRVLPGISPGLSPGLFVEFLDHGLINGEVSEKGLLDT